MMVVSTKINVLDGESCLLTLNYAYYHAICCAIQALVLFSSSKKKYATSLRLAHAFGLFAFVMDYAVGYMTTGSRSISYPNIAENLDNGWDSGDEPMGPVGVFLFFLWFDYSAFGLLLWVLDVEEQVRLCIQQGMYPTISRTVTSDFTTFFNIIFVPLQFWTAPRLESMLQIDNRQLLLRRSSSKATYFIMLLVFPCLLRYAAKMQWKRDISPIFISGIGCGLVHHAALFTFQMRGYSDFPSLIITLISEWPALITGVAVVRTLGWPCISYVLPFLSYTSGKDTQRGTYYFTMAMWLSLLLILCPHIAQIDDKDAMSYLIPMIPGEKMQTVGTAYLRMRTCIIPR